MGKRRRLRRGEAGGARRRRASPAPPPSPCSNICSMLLQDAPLRSVPSSANSRQHRKPMLRRALMKLTHSVDATRIAVASADTGGPR